ncbi:hypothetical protein M5585_04580 [Serratia ureilytica]
MARAAFVMDRLMQALGLPGKSFVPLIVGFGCNVPSIMGARTLDAQRERLITIMMAPFMSCGARLAIFAVFAAAFFARTAPGWCSRCTCSALRWRSLPAWCSNTPSCAAKPRRS